MEMNYTKNPGYFDLALDTYKAIKYYYRGENWEGYSFPQSFVKDFTHYYHFPFNESYPIFYVAILFTLARYCFEFLICKVFTKYENSVNLSFLAINFTF